MIRPKIKVAKKKHKHECSETNVLLMNVPNMLKKEECAFDMVLRVRPSVVVVEDVQTMFREEECAHGMGQRGKYVVLKDAQIKSSREEYVGGMEQRSKYAAVRQVVLPGDEIIYLKHYPLSLSHNIII